MIDSTKVRWKISQSNLWFKEESLLNHEAVFLILKCQFLNPIDSTIGTPTITVGTSPLISLSAKGMFASSKKFSAQKTEYLISEKKSDGGI